MSETKGETRYDCYFYDPKKKNCTALKKLYCSFEKRPCKFFKQWRDRREELKNENNVRCKCNNADKSTWN